MSVNAHGLPRRIPESIRREIRVRSKFGCVVCRSAIVQYEHIDPEWHDAEAHDPDHMCLLCGGCHDKVTRGLLAKSTVRARYDDVQAASKVRAPYDQFDLSSHAITVKLGSCVFQEAQTLIELDGVVVLAIEPPEPGATFPMLTGFFTDPTGRLLLSIEKNEWTGGTEVWDLDVTGPTITVRLGKGQVALRLRVEPPSMIVVEKLDMRVGEGHLLLQGGQLAVGRVTPEAEYYVTLEGLQCLGAHIGVQVTSTPIPTFRGLRIEGGKGVHLDGTGVRVGVGSPSAYILKLGIEHATKVNTRKLDVDFSVGQVTPSEGPSRL
ncbi:hypothetical protein D9M69_295140 [compost metagenome]